MSRIKNTQYLNSMKRCSLFRGIDEDELAQAVKLLDGKIRKYKSGELIMYLGSEVKYAGVVLEGTVESSFQNENYDNINMHGFSPGALFGEALVVNKIRESPVQVRTVNDCIILFLNLNKIYENDGDAALRLKLAENLTFCLAQKNMILNRKIRILSQKSLREKILACLSSFEKNPDGSVTVPLTQTALAEYMAVNRSALSREIGRMQDEGIIKGINFKKIK